VDRAASRRRLVGVLSALAILSLCASVAAAERYGNWVVQSIGRFVEAVTADQQGATLALACDGRTCVFYIDNDTSCIDGTEYFVLLNAPSGAAHVTLECRAVANSRGRTHVFAFAGGESIEEAVATQSIVSIAFPMADGSFRVSRFDTSGYAGAVAAMRALLARR
jgi:hypothetical protein